MALKDVLHDVSEGGGYRPATSYRTLKGRRSSNFVIFLSNRWFNFLSFSIIFKTVKLFQRYFFFILTLFYWVIEQRNAIKSVTNKLIFYNFFCRLLAFSIVNNITFNIYRYSRLKVLISRIKSECQIVYEIRQRLNGEKHT